jgi:hypothetical protein
MAQLKAQVDKLLTNVSSMYLPEGYISEEILPLLSVKQKSGKLGQYGASHLRLEHSLSGGRSAYRRVEPITRTSTTYDVESHGLEGLVSEDDYRNVEEPFDAEKDEVTGLSNLIWLNKEMALASALTSTSILTQNTTLTGTGQFSDYSNSDPIGVFKTARQAVYDGCGLPPNKAWMSWEVANTLAYAPAILDALGFAQNRAGQLSDAELAKAMGVEKLYIAKAKYNSAKEGQTASLATIWGKDVGFFYAPDKAAKYQVSLGYRVALSGQEQKRVFKFPVNNPPNSTGILVDDSYDFLISNALAAYLVKAAIA